MSEPSTTLIKITSGGTQRGLPINVNGRSRVLSTTEPVEVNDAELAMLANSNAGFEKVARAELLQAAPAGGEGDAAGERSPSPPQPTVDLSLLDKPIPAIVAALPGLSAAEVDALEDAETKGKTRKGVLKAIADHRLAAA